MSHNKTQKRNSCKTKDLYNSHKGNSWFSLKYAIHCKNLRILKKAVKILKKIGFKVLKQEKFGIDHIFLQPPPEILKSQNFMFVLVVSNGGNNHTVKNNIVQAAHIGFKLKSIKTFEDIHKKICNITKTIIINKPDEKSLFVDLLCGEVIEFSVKN